MKKILIIFFITIFSYSSWANFITSERSPEAICNDPSNPIVQAHVSSTNQEGGYITAEAIRAARQAVIDRCIYWVSKRREERRRVMENSCENFRTTYEGNCTTPRRTLWEGYRNLLAEAQDFQAQYLSDETEQSLEEAKDKPAGLNEAMAYYISEIGNFRAQRQNLKTLCDSLMDAREEICSVTDEVVVGEDVVTPESNTIASAELTQPVEDFVYVQKAEEITTQTFKQEEKAQTTGGELENQSQTIIENFSRILGGGSENNDGCSSGGVGLNSNSNSNCNSDGTKQRQAQHEEPENNDSQPGQQAPISEQGQTIATPNDGPGYGGGSDPQATNTNTTDEGATGSPRSELGKTGSSGPSFDASAFNSGLGGFTMNGSGTAHRNTATTRNYGTANGTSNHRSSYSAFNSSPYNGSAHSVLSTNNLQQQGSSGLPQESTSRFSAGSQLGMGTNGLSPQINGQGNLNLGDSNSNSDYQKARAHSNSRLNRAKGGKQVFSSKNANTGAHSSIFASKNNNPRDPASIKNNAFGKTKPEFDPSKYEPSLAAQQRALARATGKMISGQSRGLVVWPKDIHRHKKGSKASVFSHIRVQYQKQLLD